MENAAQSTTQNTAWYGPLKMVSLLVIALMFGAIGYGAFITLKYWTGIGV